MCCSDLRCHLRLDIANHLLRSTLSAPNTLASMSSSRSSHTYLPLANSRLLRWHRPVLQPWFVAMSELLSELLSGLLSDFLSELLSELQHYNHSRKSRKARR